MPEPGRLHPLGIGQLQLGTAQREVHPCARGQRQHGFGARAARDQQGQVICTRHIENAESQQWSRPSVKHGFNADACEQAAASNNSKRGTLYQDTNLDTVSKCGFAYSNKATGAGQNQPYTDHER